MLHSGNPFFVLIFDQKVGYCRLFFSAQLVRLKCACMLLSSILHDYEPGYGHMLSIEIRCGVHLVHYFGDTVFQWGDKSQMAPRTFKR